MEPMGWSNCYVLQPFSCKRFPALSNLHFYSWAELVCLQKVLHCEETGRKLPFWSQCKTKKGQPIPFCTVIRSRFALWSGRVEPVRLGFHGILLLLALILSPFAPICTGIHRENEASTLCFFYLHYSWCKVCTVIETKEKPAFPWGLSWWTDTRCSHSSSGAPYGYGCESGTGCQAAQPAGWHKPLTGESTWRLWRGSHRTLGVLSGRWWEAHP